MSYCFEISGEKLKAQNNVREAVLWLGRVGYLKHTYF